jgi:hypothetical protein
VDRILASHLPAVLDKLLYHIVADANKQRSIPGSEWKKVPVSHGASRAIAGAVRFIIRGTS